MTRPATGIPGVGAVRDGGIDVRGTARACPVCGYAGPDVSEYGFDSGGREARCGDPWHDRNRESHPKEQA